MKLFAAGPSPKTRAERLRRVWPLLGRPVFLVVDVLDPRRGSLPSMALGAACAGPILAEVGFPGRSPAPSPSAPCVLAPA